MNIAYYCKRIEELRHTKSVIYLNTNQTYFNNPIFEELDRKIDGYEKLAIEEYHKFVGENTVGQVSRGAFLIAYPIYEDYEKTDLLWLITESYAVTVMHSHLEMVHNRGKLLDDIQNRLEVLVEEGYPIELEAPDEE